MDAQQPEDVPAQTSTDIPYKLGVLCVHGIGDQRPGETLNRCLGSLSGWMEDWLGHHTDKKLKFGKSVLNRGRLLPGEPCHAELILENTEPPDTVYQKWLFAESWWAQDFSPPPFSRLASWLLTSGSWTVLSHIGALLVERGEKARVTNWVWRKPRNSKVLKYTLNALYIIAAVVVVLVSFVGALAAVILLQIVVVVLWILSIIPVPKLRTLLRDIALMIQGVLGDSFVFTFNPLIRAAVSDRIRHDLQWLRDQGCEKIAVLAHSQGSAVAYHALQDIPTGTVNHFITYGSGLIKLSDLQERARKRGFDNLIKYVFLFVPVYVIIFPTVWELFSERMATVYSAFWTFIKTFSFDELVTKYDPVDLSFYFFLIPIAFLVIFIYAMFRQQDIRAVLKNEFDKTLENSGSRWTDLYASHDPIPNGPLFENDDNPLMLSHEVVNHMSAISDHVSYWDNKDEFVSWIAKLLDTEAGSGLIGDDDLLAIDAAFKRRRKRVKLLRNCRRLLFLSLLIPVLMEWDRVAEFGSRLAGLLLPDSFSKYVDTVRTELASTAFYNSEWLALTWHGVAEAWYWALGLIIPVLLAVFWQRLTKAVWKGWDQSASSALVEANEANYYFRRMLLWFIGLLPVY